VSGAEGKRKGGCDETARLPRDLGELIQVPPHPRGVTPGLDPGVHLSSHDSSSREDGFAWS